MRPSVSITPPRPRRPTVSSPATVPCAGHVVVSRAPARSRFRGTTASAEPPAPVPLSRAALALRTAHAGISVAFLSSIAYVWWCALTRRRSRLLRVAVGALTCEGVAVAANGGDCPLGRLQQRVGDPGPPFELALSPPAARLALPAPGAGAAAGIALVAAPPPPPAPTPPR